MMAALDSIIGGLPLLTARTIIAAFLLIRAALLAPLVVLLILLAGILGLSASLVTHLIVLVLICHLRILSRAEVAHYQNPRNHVAVADADSYRRINRTVERGRSGPSKPNLTKSFMP
ncbi:hypothetical protein TomTYG75_06270 [Sphingobium sp. TomTYG75]